MTRRVLTGLLSLAVAAGALLVGSATAQAATPGELLTVKLRDLRPTQPAIGHDQIFYKLGRYSSAKDSLNKEFDDWCEANGQEEAASAKPGATLRDPSSFTCTVPVGQETPDTVAAMKTVVIGPGGALYLTDGHHTFTSLLETPDGGPDTRVRVRVQDDLSRLSPAAFWQEMQKRNLVWLRTADGKAITPDQLPQGLGLARLGDDPYRGLVYFTRDVGYAPPADAPEYLEFYWADWLRPQVALTDADRNDPARYLAVIEKASRLMSATAGTTPIAPGRDADAMGRMASWNDGKKVTGGEFGDLSKPITDKKPGKVAYAVDFRSRIPADPACTQTITGKRAGAVLVSSGVTCLQNADVSGAISVRAGASLISHGSSIRGAVSAVGARTVEVCGTSLTGAFSAVRTTDRLTLTGPGCTPNDLRGPVVTVP
jgi:hypothetical protein